MQVAFPQHEWTSCIREIKMTPFLLFFKSCPRWGREQATVGLADFGFKWKESAWWSPVITLWKWRKLEWCLDWWLRCPHPTLKSQGSFSTSGFWLQPATIAEPGELVMAQVIDHWTELLAPCFSLPQFQLLLAFEEWTSRWECSLSLLSCSFSASQINKWDCQNC